MAQIGVDAVGEGDVDDAVLAGKGNGWFCAIAGEGEKPFACTTGKKTPSVSLIIRLPQTVERVATSIGCTDQAASTFGNASLPRGD